MYKFGIVLIFSVLISFAVNAKTIDQKKEELKKIYEAGGISKLEYEKGIESLEKPKGQNKKIKKILSLSKKKKSKNKINSIFNNKEKDKEEITLEKIEELGKPVKFDDTYYTKGMIKKFKGCNNSFKCRGDKAGRELFNTFNKRNKAWQQQNPGQMIKTMAMFEVFYSSKLWYARKALKRYKKDEYKGSLRKKKDEKEIRSLLGLYKGRNSMREALGMTPEISSQEAIKKFWLLGEFLDLGTGVKNKKLASDLKKRQELLTAYKNQISNLKKKLQDDIEEDDDEKSVE